MFAAPSCRRFGRAGMIAASLLLAALAFAGTPAAAQSPTQIKLTEKQIQNFIAAQKPLSAVTDKIQGGASDKPDPKLQAELEAVAKKNGFKSLSEYDDVATAISLVMAGIDPDTKQFTEPQESIKKDIAEVEADKAMPADEKKQMLAELNDTLKKSVPMQYPENVPLVVKYYDKIDAVLQ
jgi:seryl-tRNA synthetase